MRVWLALLPVLMGSPGFADDASLCDRAALQAANEYNIPPGLLLAITRVETARYGSPWPWTVNIGGKGDWFDTADQALAATDAAIANGENQIDIGCFQLNLRWHRAAFHDLHTMIDPLENARYAARFLTTHYSETGNWRQSAAAYHSRTDDLGEAYIAQLKATEGQKYSEEFPYDARPTNRFPLLTAGQAGAVGSLVTTTGRLSPLIEKP